jgi:hypothetical protein
MPRKPDLTIVSPATTGIAPPRPVGKHGRLLWDEIMHEYGIQDRCGIELLAQASEELDMIEGLSEDVARDGRTIRSRAGVRGHPAIRDIRQGRAVLAKLLKELGVSTQAIKAIGRPPSPIGWSGDDE